MKTIEIYQPTNPVRQHTIYFTDRNGTKVFARVEDPCMYLTTQQQTDLFLADRGRYRFKVSDSIIKDLEKLINWPA